MRIGLLELTQKRQSCPIAAKYSSCSFPVPPDLSSYLEWVQNGMGMKSRACGYFVLWQSGWFVPPSPPPKPFILPVDPQEPPSILSGLVWECVLHLPLPPRGRLINIPPSSH